MKIVTSLGLAALIYGFSVAGLAGAEEIAFPEGYRNWLHVKTMIIKPGHPLENPFQGIHHVYANSKAAYGLRNGTYENGAVLVFDLLNYSEKDQTVQEGPRKLVGVMRKDSNKFAATGGWGFEGFAGDSKAERLVKDGGKSCYTCHESAKNSDYVFSQLRK